MIQKLRGRWNRYLNRKAIARYAFDQKLLGTLTEDEREMYSRVSLGADVASASFLEMRRLEAQMELRSGVMLADRP